MQKLLRALVVMMLVASVALVGCSGQQDERDNNGIRNEEGVTTTTPDGTDDGLGTDTDQGVGDEDQENEGPKTNGGTNY